MTAPFLPVPILLTVTFPPIPLLDGDGVRLRPLAERDADALFALHSDERVMRYWSFLPWTRRQQALDHIARLARERAFLEFYPWAATLPDSDVAIGTCTLFGVHREHARAVIGYALAPVWWGRGLGTRMLRLALDFAFDALELDRIEADIDPLNTASCRLAERVGFQHERPVREHRRVNGDTQNTALYALSRKDYRTRGCAAADSSAQLA